MANSFTRPPRIKGGGTMPIKASDINQVGRCIEELQNAIRTTTGNSSPFVPSRLPPFWGSVTQVPESDPAEYQATFTLGYLTYQNAGANESEQGVTGYIVPKILNGDGQLIGMDEQAPVVVPAVVLPGVVSFVYLRVKTDADGIPKFDGESVTIEAFDEAQQSIHHVRPSPSGGEEEGDYFFLLLETESNDATPTPAPRVVRRLTGNREMPNQLVEITNIGGKRELYKGYLSGPDDKHEFRTLEQLEGDGEPVIKDLDPGDPEADPPVAGEEEGPTIKFRRVAERATSPQVQVKDGDDVIRIEGNGFDGTYIDAFGGQVGFTDGLCTNIQGGTFEGKNLNLTVERFEWIAGGPSGEMIRLSIAVDAVHYWRNGIYAGTVDPGDAPEGLIEQTVTRMTESS